MKMNPVEPFIVDLNGVKCVLTVGQFMDENYPLILCLENFEDQEYVATCNTPHPQSILDFIVVPCKPIAHALINAGVVEEPRNKINLCSIFCLTEKAKDYIKELEIRG